ALSLALKNRRVIDKVAFVNLGRVERDDLIPQMADFSLSFEGIEWAFVSGVFESNYIISIRNVGYVRSAGRVLKEAFGDIGSAGGHASMAKAIIPIKDRKSTRLNSSHVAISYAVFCLKKKTS